MRGRLLRSMWPQHPIMARHAVSWPSFALLAPAISVCQGQTLFWRHDLGGPRSCGMVAKGLMSLSLPAKVCRKGRHLRVGQRGGV